MRCIDNAQHELHVDGPAGASAVTVKLLGCMSPNVKHDGGALSALEHGGNEQRVRRQRGGVSAHTLVWPHDSAGPFGTQTSMGVSAVATNAVGAVSW